MIMLASNSESDQLNRMRQELSEVLNAASGTWVVKLTNRELFFVVDRRENKACIATPVARLAAVDEQRVDRLVAEQVGSDCRYLRSGRWLWAQSVCPASSLAVDELIERIARVGHLADKVLQARVWGQGPKSQSCKDAARPSQQDSLITAK